jgi:hypothetical protein
LFKENSLTIDKGKLDEDWRSMTTKGRC